jgi:hypothetical protein
VVHGSFLDAFLSWPNTQRRTGRICWPGGIGLRTEALKFPQRWFVAAAPIDSQGMTVFLRAFLGAGILTVVLLPPGNTSRSFSSRAWRST